MKTTHELAAEVALLVEQKRADYGDSVSSSEAMLQLLYPQGVAPDQLGDMLLIARMLDKLQRLATGRAAGESPYLDLAGYALRGLEHHTRNEEARQRWQESVNGQTAPTRSTEPSDSAAASAPPPTTENASVTSETASPQPSTPSTASTSQPTALRVVQLVAGTVSASAVARGRERNQQQLCAWDGCTDEAMVIFSAPLIWHTVHGVLAFHGTFCCANFAQMNEVQV